MNRNTRLPDSAYGDHIRNSRRDCASESIDARIAAMRAGGMSIQAIRRTLGLNEAAATAAGLLEPGRLTAAPATDVEPTDVRALTARGPTQPVGLNMADVLDAVARDAGIERETLITASQWRPAVRARQLVMILVRELCPRASLPAIGFMLHRDRTTVLYGCRRAEVLLRRDRAFRAAYRRILRALSYGNPKAGAGNPKAGSRG